MQLGYMQETLASPLLRPHGRVEEKLPLSVLTESRPCLAPSHKGRHLVMEAQHCSPS